MGPWQLRHTVGQGSFAVVWRAEHAETGEVAAVKEINTARLSPKLLEGLQREVAVLQRARHPHIVRLYSIFRRPKAERLYLVLEYCAGGDLAHHVRRHGRVPEPEARVLTRQLASGLRCLRQHNLMHRDLKPQNLLLSGAPGAGGVLKIADFGFARDVQEAGLAETLCGSPLYMAPEILQNRRYGVKADLWSVGAVLFELVSGKPPYGGMNHLQLLRNIETKEARLPPAVAAELSPECRDLIARLLKRSPLERLSFEGFFSHCFVGLTDPPGPAHAAVVVERTVGMGVGARRGGGGSQENGSAGCGGDGQTRGGGPGWVRDAGAGTTGGGGEGSTDKVQGALVVRPARSRQNSQNGEQSQRLGLSEISDDSSLDREYVFIDAEGARPPDGQAPSAADCSAARSTGLTPLPDYCHHPPRAGEAGAGASAPPPPRAAPAAPSGLEAAGGERGEVERMDGDPTLPGAGRGEETSLSPSEELARRLPLLERTVEIVAGLAKRQEAILDALSLYLIAAKVAHAAIGVLKTPLGALERSTEEHASKQLSLGATAAAMAEAAQAAASKLAAGATDLGEEILPDSVELVYQHALGCARQGAVDEMLGNAQSSCKSYEEAEVLLQFLCIEFPWRGLSRADLIRMQEYISHIRSRRMHTLSKSALRGSPQGLESPGRLEEQLAGMNLRG